MNKKTHRHSLRPRWILVLAAATGCAVGVSYDDDASQTTPLDAGSLLDAGDLDSGQLDGGFFIADTGVTWDASTGPVDAGSDAGARDAGSDAGARDAGSDAGPRDAGTPDAGKPDAGTTPDAGGSCNPNNCMNDCSLAGGTASRCCKSDNSCACNWPIVGCS